MGGICGDNRFEIIAKAKKNLLESTNIHTSEDEMKALDRYLFRCWQMGWLERYDKPKEPLDIPTMSTDFAKEHGLPCPEGYIFKAENGNVINATKIVLEKKKKEYPKTYDECCEVLGIGSYFEPEIRNATTEECHKFTKLIRLKRCRDAYWKLYGEEMGLGKPWKTDWTSFESYKYIIEFHENKIRIANTYNIYSVFAFPTEEMRDAFKENFDKDLEFCKELL